ncbi:unnamed protein product [Fraxinus pennsylvanica]|uniref:Uncharacterized protein n=1 Tax=Fraxinus pennsylvanica TaxID=56036 RepID=A0AAD1YMW8_9LAMI|nr:unnamed protein product [Fraxinus pennsylvanica]
MGRSPCCKPEAHTKKGTWTKEEDEILVNYITLHGEVCWRSLPKAAGLLRCGKSCRLRWINYLRPDLKRGDFTREEDEIIIRLHSLLGNNSTPPSSSTTEETQPHSQLQHEQNTAVAVDLELSIGLPYYSTPVPKVPGQFYRPVTVPPLRAQVPAKAICLCWQLGLQNRQLCKCQIKE